MNKLGVSPKRVVFIRILLFSKGQTRPCLIHHHHLITFVMIYSHCVSWWVRVVLGRGFHFDRLFLFSNLKCCSFRFADALLADLQTTLHANGANLNDGNETWANDGQHHVTSQSYQYQHGEIDQQVRPYWTCS